MNNNKIGFRTLDFYVLIVIGRNLSLVQTNSAVMENKLFGLNAFCCEKCWTCLYLRNWGKGFILSTKFFKKMNPQIKLIYFEWPTYSLTSLDSTKQVNLILLNISKAPQSQTSDVVQWYFPLQSNWVFFWIKLDKLNAYDEQRKIDVLTTATTRGARSINATMINQKSSWGINTLKIYFAAAGGL